MATKAETLVSELKINYLTEELYQEALTNGELNDNEIYMTESDISSVATELANMYVWKKFDAEPVHTTETVTDQTIYSSMTYETISYSDKVEIVDGKVSLFLPKTGMFFYYDMEKIKGRYFLRNSVIYYLPSDSELTITSSTTGSYTSRTVKTSTATKYISTTATELGIVVSNSESTYPTNGEQDGMWYVYNGKFGETIEFEKIADYVAFASDHTHNEYMTKADPIGTGSFSMNRLDDSTVGDYSATLGTSCVASGSGAVASGYKTTSSGEYSHTEGYITEALNYQHAQGHYNDKTTATAGTKSGTAGTAFVIGNGTSSTAANACRITYSGQVVGKLSYSTAGADYSEYFEWADGNPENEERVGYFVTFEDGRFIKKANEGEYILGIVSGNPAVIGNHDECWMGQNEMDEWGRFIYVTETETDEETGEIHEYQTYKINPDYDKTVQYIPRSERQEWDTVGMLGVLSVRDDGTCQVNGYCKVADGGIATASDTGYRVVERVTENIVKVIFR